MTPVDFADYHVGFIIVFFIYGLAFFSMGLTIVLEAGRFPLLAQGRALIPLGLFGLLHGTHEWLEIFILQGQWLGVSLPEQLSWARLALLAFSFTFLAAYALHFLGPGRAADLGVGKKTYAAVAGLFGLYFLVVAAIKLFWPDCLGNSARFYCNAGTLSRYLLAVPGATMAGIALHLKARDAMSRARPDLAACFRYASIGFFVYALTQVLVSSIVRPTGAVSIFGFELFHNASLAIPPVQTIRAMLAVLIAASLIRTTHIVEQERQRQLLAAKQFRLEALEKFQQELEKRAAMRRELLRNTIIAQEEERARIARELHDESAQTITAASLNLASLKNMLPDRPEINVLIDRLQDLCRQLAKGLYRLVHDLRPAQLDDLGLVQALRYLVDEGQKPAGLLVTLDVQGSAKRLDPLVETALFRGVQEALTNVARHAQTKQAGVALIFESDRIKVRIRDEGCGFNPLQANSRHCAWGLAGMRERAEAVGGTLQVQSRPGAGTTIEIEVPLEGKGIGREGIG